MTSPIACDSRRAFQPAPDPRRYFAASSIEDARLRIVRAVARNEGPALLIGGSGTGKSLLMAVVAEKFAKLRTVISLSGGQICTRRGLLQSILAEVDLPYRGLDEGELRLSLMKHIRGEGGPPRRLFLVVDEADSLAPRLLKELRQLTNLAADGTPLVSLVLAGSNALEERFAEPQLESFSQRIAARAYLAPLGRDETFQYVRAQAAAAGLAPDRLFAPDALEAIHAATGGVPRLINQLGDQLLWMVEETGVTPLDGSLVQQAWSDLQQLPAPWHADAHLSVSATSVGVVEFGELDADEATAVIEGPAVLRRSRAAALADRDDMPASIPIESARPRRDLPEAAAIAAQFEVAEQLVSKLERFDADDRADDDPFGGSFDEEEVVRDRYAEFETALLQTAPRATNRLDRGFAAELAGREAKTKAQGEVMGGVSDAEFAHHGESAPTATEAAPLPAVIELPKSAHSADLLVVEDDDQRSAAAIVPARHFRRLFSTLEANARSLSG